MDDFFEEEWDTPCETSPESPTSNGEGLPPAERPKGWYQHVGTMRHQHTFRKRNTNGAIRH